MEDLFRSYWWLLFPLGFFLYGAYEEWLKYRRHKDRLSLIRSYIDQGRDPPPELLAKLGRRRKSRRRDDEDEDEHEYGYGLSADLLGVGGGQDGLRRGSRESGWQRVVLFGALSAGFGYAAVTDLHGGGEAFVIVAFVMGALFLASLVGVLMSRRD